VVSTDPKEMETSLQSMCYIGFHHIAWARSCERANFCKEMFEHWMNDVPDKLLDEFLSYMRYDKDDFGVVNLDQFTRSCEAWLARKSKEPSFAQQLEDWCKLSVHYSKPR